MKGDSSLHKQILAYIRTFDLAQPEEHWLVAVSGGRDSCVLLHLLTQLKDTLGIRLSVAHFDHQLRRESAFEQAFVGDLAAQYGLSFHWGSADVQALAKGKNLEEVARKERYAFLRRTMANTGAQKIATAHHAQDQAETMLLHLMRGSGLEGLAAMAPLEQGIVRPLLFALPEQIYAYSKGQGLSYCQDNSNFSTRYTRNRVRLELIPDMQSYNPHLVQALVATADICREENDLVDDLAETALAELWLDEQQALNGVAFDALPLALKRRVLRKAFALVAGEVGELSFVQVNAALELKEEQSCSWPNGWLAYRRGALYISRSMPELPQHTGQIPILADGSWHALADWGWAYRAELTTDLKTTPEDFLLPAQALNQLYFRTRRAGDTIRSNHKNSQDKVKDIFIKQKIPPYLRAGWPLLCWDEQIVWLPYIYCRQLAIQGEVLRLSIRPDPAAAMLPL